MILSEKTKSWAAFLKYKKSLWSFQIKMTSLDVYLVISVNFLVIFSPYRVLLRFGSILTLGEKMCSVPSLHASTGRPYFIVLHFITLSRYFVFYRLGWGNPLLNKSISTIFLTVFAHFMSWSHFCNSYHISNVFIMFVMVICGQWSLMLESFWVPWRCLYRMMNLIGK